MGGRGVGWESEKDEFMKFLLELEADDFVSKSQIWNKLSWSLAAVGLGPDFLKFIYFFNHTKTAFRLELHLIFFN